MNSLLIAANFPLEPTGQAKRNCGERKARKLRGSDAGLDCCYRSKEQTIEKAGPSIFSVGDTA
jgi:hypothetical protein